MTPCTYPGCPRAAQHKGRCAEHRHLDRRPHSDDRGYDRTWRRLRQRVIAEQPLCVRCLERGIVRPADLVHHIVPISVDPTLRLAPRNLQPLCRDCHGEVHRRGGGAKFAGG